MRYFSGISVLAILGALICTSACHPSQRPPPAAAATDVTPNAFVGTPREAAARLNETLVLRDNPGLAQRDGSVLTIRYLGKDVITYTDDPGGCERYVIERAIKLYETQSRRLESVALVACHFGTITNRYLVQPSSGKYVVSDDVAASPDGHRLATSDSSPGKHRGEFVIIEWPDIDRRAAFATACKDIMWQNNSHLTADCWHSNGPNTLNPYETDAVFFRARIWNDRGIWRMRGTQRLRAETFEPMDSNTPLPDFTATNKQGVNAPE